MKEKPEKTNIRKKDHLEICLNEDVEFKTKTTGFEFYEFEHYAITEVNYKKIDIQTTFLDHKLEKPFLISCMTGGAKEAEKINEQLAAIANELNIALGVGSQRQALHDDTYLESYRIIRQKAPGIPILGNIGASQIAKSNNPLDFAKRLINMVEADALVVHLNSLQELLQPEGEPDFGGLLNNLERICSKIKKPVIVKEVGSGISFKAAKKLLEIGVKGIDIAGSGGTSWAAVELKRSNKESEFFRNWGIPTAESLAQVAQLKQKYDFSLISSGGINNGVLIAKSLAMGADITASARSLLKILINEGEDKLIFKINEWFGEVKKIMYLTGSKSLKDLRKNKLKKIGG